MVYPKEILVEDYFDIHEYYENIYGKNRTVILMQVGSFHECYSTPTRGLDLDRLSQELNCVVSCKKGKEQGVSENNWAMMGFPIFASNNFVEKLVEMNYTVIVIDQVTSPPKPKRQVTRIESPGTFIDNSKNKDDTNFIVSLYFDKISKNDNLICCGMASYDLYTGRGFFYESYSKKNDTNYALDDTIRFLELCPPKEILLHFTFEDEKDNIISFLKLNKDVIYTLGNYSDFKKVKYQEKLFNKVYNIKSQVNVFDYLDLTFLNWSRVALTSLLDYVKNHKISLLKDIKEPELFSNDQNLYLGNRAIDQLNVITNNNKSLFDIINFTKTAMGRRMLREQLINPLINKDELNIRYNLISDFINKEVNIVDDLKHICDIERISRRIEMDIIHPYELVQLSRSFESYIKIIKRLKEHNIKNLKYKKDKKIVKEFIKKLKDTYDFDVIRNVNFSGYVEEERNIFNNGVHEDMDSLCKEIEFKNNFIDILIDELSKYIKDKPSKHPFISKKCNDTEGYYLTVSNKRAKLLLDALPEEINIGDITINKDDLNITKLKSTTKIKFRKLRQFSNEIIALKRRMAKMTRSYFYEDLNKINITFNDIVSNISMIDFVNSGYIAASKLGYCKPEIKDYDNSYFTAKELRHPIIECINNDVIYVPHNISLGKDVNGILLFGINASGKSTLMKSIGLNIILAQIGYYVSAKEFEFNPYKSLFTRISGNDDIYRGLSSFMVEMTELMSILKRNDSNTLVIGDEICKGTEEKSANIIVAYMLENLTKSDTSFITATHLHKIADLKTVKNLKKVKPYHLKVDYDDDKEIIIYNRELVEGVGENFYGLQVAKYLMKDEEFNKRTLEIMNEYDENNKKSRYNSDLVLDECYFCKSKNKLECHHINWQKDFNKNKVKKKQPHIKKNKIYNLMVVCSSCHDKIDRGEIDVKGYKMTSNGVELEYK